MPDLAEGHSAFHFLEGVQLAKKKNKHFFLTLFGREVLAFFEHKPSREISESQVTPMYSESCPSLGHLLLSHPPVPFSVWWLLGLAFLTSPPGPALQAESVPKVDFCISHRVLPLKGLGC